MNNSIAVWIVVAIVIIVGGWYLFTQKPAAVMDTTQNTPTVTATPTTLPSTTPPSTITWDSETQGTFKGYYNKFTRNLGEEYGSGTCSTFVVVSGQQDLIAYFKNLVTYGNAVNTINENGNLQINLPWEQMSESDRAKVLASSPKQLVQIELKKKIAEGKGASACFSFLSFVKVL